MFSVGTVTAVAAAASAASAGLHAETASVASRSASASALAAAAVKTAVEGEIRRTRLMDDGGQTCAGRGAFVCWEAEEKMMTVQEDVEGDEEQQWEVAHSVAVASLNNLAVLLSEQGEVEVVL